MQASTDSLLALIDDILDFSRGKAERLMLEAFDFNLRAAVEDVTDMLAIQAHNKGLTICCLVNPEVPVFVCGDSGKIRQVLIDLIGNAIKFTKNGEILIRVSLVEEAASHIKARFVITDTGMGMTPARLERVMNSFTLDEATIRQRYGEPEGGLDLSKKIVEMMGGRMGIESEAGKGTSCWFTVVLEKGKEAGSAEIIVPEDFCSKRILVADGHVVNRLVAGELLQAWGCRYDKAANSSQALDILHQAVAERDPFHIVLIDMQMPEMAGETLSQKIKADLDLRDIPMGMIAPMEQHIYEDEMQKTGFSACLTRPIKKFNLFNCLCTLFGCSSRRNIKASASLRTGQISGQDNKKEINILLADDNVVNQTIALRILEDLGCSADVVENGKEAIAALETGPYDLVLMDVEMPEMNGLEAVEIIRDPQSMVHNHNIPVIAMTTTEIKGAQEKYLESGMDDYICKPITDSALNEVLTKYLAFKESSTIAAPVQILKSVEVLQIEHMQQIANGDADFVQELISLFLADNGKRLMTLEAALQDFNAEQFEYEAHVMHGSCATAGAKRMQEIASRLEQIGASGELSPAFEQFDKLKFEFKKVAGYFQEYIYSQKSSSFP